MKHVFCRCVINSFAQIISTSHLTSAGACEYGSFGATLNDGDVSASSSLYRNGVGCGACYQVSEITTITSFTHVDCIVYVTLPSYNFSLGEMY